MEYLQDMKGIKGTVPLHLVIQCKTGLKWGLQAQLAKSVLDLDLLLIDQRTWHPRGMNAIVITELYVQDSKTTITIKGGVKELSVDDLDLDNMEEGGEISESQIVTQRMNDITEVMLKVINQSAAEVKVIRWLPHVLESGGIEITKHPDELKEKLESEAKMNLDNAEVIDTLLDIEPQLTDGKAHKMKTLSGPIETLSRKGSDSESVEVGKILTESTQITGKKDQEVKSTLMPGIEESEGETHPLTESIHPASAAIPPTLRHRGGHRHKTLSVPAFAARGLWDDDSESHGAVLLAVDMPTVTYDFTSPKGTRRRQVSMLSQMIDKSMLPTLEEHLEGFVRCQSDTVKEKDEHKHDK